MKWSGALVAAASLTGLACAQSDSTAYTDAETGIKFQSFTDAQTNASFRIALPDKTEGSYDAIIQIEGPATLGWIGVAWAGTMAYNPLTLTWPSGTNTIHSSRMAYGFYTPSDFPDATYKVLKGTHITNGILKFTAVCTGCATWKDYDGNTQTIDLSAPTRLAFAVSNTAPETPSDPASNFNIHDVVGHWYADLAASKSADFASWVTANTPGGNGSVALKPTRRYKWKGGF